MYPPLKAADFGSTIVVSNSALLGDQLPVELNGIDHPFVLTPIRADYSICRIEHQGNKYQTRNVVCAVDKTSTQVIIPVCWFLDAINDRITGVQRKSVVVEHSPHQQCDRRQKSKKVQNAIAVRSANHPVKPNNNTGLSKKDQAVALLEMHPNIARQAAIRLLVEKVGLTPAGASTYFQLYRSK